MRNGTGSGRSTVFAKPHGSRYRLRQAHAGDVAAIADPKPESRCMRWGQRAAAGGTCRGTSAGAPIIAAAYAINGGRVNYAADAYSQATA